MDPLVELNSQQRAGLESVYRTIRSAARRAYGSEADIESMRIESRGGRVTGLRVELTVPTTMPDGGVREVRSSRDVW